MKKVLSILAVAIVIVYALIAILSLGFGIGGDDNVSDTPGEYQITFDANRKDVIAPQSIDVTLDSYHVFRLPTPSVGFIGWYYKNTKVLDTDDLNKLVGNKARVELVAKWDNVGYTLRYNVGSSFFEAQHSNIDPMAVTSNTVYTFLPASSKEANFVGWSYDDTIVKNVAELNKLVNINILTVTLLAKWSI